MSVEPVISASDRGQLWSAKPIRYRMRRILTISPDEASFATRGFEPADSARQKLLELIGVTFVTAFNAAIEHADPAKSSVANRAVTPDLQGFAFEGAAMAFALLDILSLRRGRRFNEFICGGAGAHAYVAYVGAGWALARTSLRLKWRLGELDPLLQWLLIDGMGFHAGYFHHNMAVFGQRRPRVLHGYARRVFDQGLGRALWFVLGADVVRVGARIQAFDESRRADLWSGAGLAATYAGGVGEPELWQLLALSGAYRSHLAQGVAFAVEARSRAQNVVEHTIRSARILCGMDIGEVCRAVEEARAQIHSAGCTVPYESWRTNLRLKLQPHAREANNESR